MLRSSLRCRVGKRQYFWRAASLQNYASPSPRTLRARSSQRKNLNAASRSRKFPDTPRWPTDVFATAYQNGVMKVAPLGVNNFLNDIWHLANSRQLDQANVRGKLEGIVIPFLQNPRRLMLSRAWIGGRRFDNDR